MLGVVRSFPLLALSFQLQSDKKMRTANGHLCRPPRRRQLMPCIAGLIAGIVFVLFSTGTALAKGFPSGSSPNSWIMGLDLSDSGNQCEPAFAAQTGASTANGFTDAYYSSQAAAVADASAAFPGQVYLAYTDPANPQGGIPEMFVYGIHGCTGTGLGPVIFSFVVYYDSSSTGNPPVGPNGNPCPVNVTLTNPLPQYMQAKFTVPSSATLSSYASTCGFSAFDWQQQITYDPGGSSVTPNVPSNLPNNVYPSTCSTVTPAM
jgi:hypothetical protein